MRFAVFCLMFVCAAAANAQAEVRAYAFEWQGAGGYRVTGGLAFDTDQVAGSVVRETDLTCFAIEGRKDGREIGRWALGMRIPDTTWRLHFVPSVPGFVVEGLGIDMPQAWNMNGAGNDCGPGGFGFNIGDFAQDICVDGTLIEDSQVSPFQPFEARRNDGYIFPPDACLGPLMMSRLRL